MKIPIKFTRYNSALLTFLSMMKSFPGFLVWMAIFCIGPSLIAYTLELEYPAISIFLFLGIIVGIVSFICFVLFVDLDEINAKNNAQKNRPQRISPTNDLFEEFCLYEDNQNHETERKNAPTPKNTLSDQAALWDVFSQAQAKKQIKVLQTIWCCAHLDTDFELHKNEIEEFISDQLSENVYTLLSAHEQNDVDQLLCEISEKSFLFSYYKILHLDDHFKVFSNNMCSALSITLKSVDVLSKRDTPEQTGIKIYSSLGSTEKIVSQTRLNLYTIS